MYFMLPFLFSCATYNTKLAGYYSALQNGKYTKAEEQLTTNRFLQANRNELLLLLEKGKLYHLMEKYDSSNLFFNAADKFWENNYKSVGDIAKGALLNPMTQAYLGEPFERLMVHYYKAINYSILGKPNEALVEARRITLSSNAINDFQKNERKYNSDAFLYNIQAIIYELNADYNNAFIAYRNAIELYTKQPNNTFYGTPIPIQLQKDIIRTASIMGFTDQANKYEKLFGMKAEPTTSKNEAIIFIEQGLAPIKYETGFTIVNSNNGFHYRDATGSFINVPFNASYYNNSNLLVNSLRTIRLALPAYATNTNQLNAPTITYNNNSFTSEIASNINQLAIGTLQERMLKEIANAIARQLLKYAVQKGTEAATKQIVKNNSKQKDDNKKKDNSETAAAFAGLLVNIINTATEKADTRNWQSLPAFINYVRIPLVEGQKTIQVNNGVITKTILLQSTKGLQLASVRFKG
jgi:uncharacterized protein